MPTCPIIAGPVTNINDRILCLNVMVKFSIAKYPSVGDSSSTRLDRTIDLR